eukprot:Selendium_serpulae@DN5490_c0_g2_i1.p1
MTDGPGHEAMRHRREVLSKTEEAFFDKKELLSKTMSLVARRTADRRLGRRAVGGRTSERGARGAERDGQRRAADLLQQQRPQRVAAVAVRTS